MYWLEKTQQKLAHKNSQATEFGEKEKPVKRVGREEGLTAKMSRHFGVKFEKTLRLQTLEKEVCSNSTLQEREDEVVNQDSDSEKQAPVVVKRSSQIELEKATMQKYMKHGRVVAKIRAHTELSQALQRPVRAKIVARKESMERLALNNSLDYEESAQHVYQQYLESSRQGFLLTQKMRKSALH